MLVVSETLFSLARMNIHLLFADYIYTYIFIYIFYIYLSTLHAS